MQMPRMRKMMPARMRENPALRAWLRPVKRVMRPLLYRSWRGVCPICEKPVRFYAMGAWYRDQLVCGSCQSIPRERALIHVVKLLYPNWRELRIHESSPGRGGASGKLKQECARYTSSHYDRSLAFGTIHPTLEYRSEDLENQTFADESFDLVITQDVFEHVFRPDKAIHEIARTLRPGGAHIMTVPIVNKNAPSCRRAALQDGHVTHYVEPNYHGNPIDSKGSLVTVDWGYDIVSYLSLHSGLPTAIFHHDDLSQGMRAEYNEVVVTRKIAAPMTI